MHAGIDRRQQKAPAEVGIVLYPGSQLAAAHGLTDLLAIADRLAREAQMPGLRTTHWQLTGEPQTMDCVFDSRPAGRPQPQVLILPPTLIDLPAPEALAAIAGWLGERHAGGATLASVCSGAFVLAETGLLAGRAASTHWSCANELAEKFPQIEVDTHRRLIDEGDLITAGGFMAWVDIGLCLVERISGPAIRAETARFLLAEPAATAAPSGFVPPLSHGDAAILRLQHWLHTRDAREVSLAAMAEAAVLEKRTLLRRFARATGMTPLEYCRRLRVARAIELMEAGKSAPEIAWAVGYSDPGAFARVFRKITGRTPGAYRQALTARRQPAHTEVAAE